MHWFKYVKNYGVKVRDQKRLIMTLLCRNEVDIIESNIRTHARLGVDAFIVMDNMSTDGTREVLVSLQEELDLTIIDQTSNNYQQAKWMQQLVHEARRLGADWVISNDADEFWLPQENGKNLKDYLSQKDSIVTVCRSNVLLSEEVFDSEQFDFSKSPYRVKTPIHYPEYTRVKDDNVLILFNPTPPKVIVNPNGFIKISGGNHRAKHIGKFLTAREEPNIHIYHYPIRSWEHFEESIQNRKRLLSETSAKMGRHYLRWVRLLNEGKLEEEYERFVVREEKINCMLDAGLITHDDLPSKLIVN